jgi:hypothetical protein
MAGWGDDRHNAAAVQCLAEAISMLARNGANHESIQRAMDAKLAEARGHADAVLNRYKEDDGDAEED